MGRKNLGTVTHKGASLVGLANISLWNHYSNRAKEGKSIIKTSDFGDTEILCKWI